MAQPAQDSDTVFRADTRIVVCHTTVIDKTGHLVTTLPQSAFTVLREQGQAGDPQVSSAKTFRSSLGLVIDNSGSMRNKLEKVKAAALALVKDSNRDDEVFVVNFNDTAYLDNPKDKNFTNDIGELETALARIDARGGTAMRDAIEMSIQHLKKAHRDKKVLVVITDGNDNSSLLSLERIMKSAHQSDVLIYGVGLLSRGRAPRGGPRPARAQRPGRGHRRQDLLPQGCGGSGRDRASGGARYPQPVHHRILAFEFGDGQHLPRDPDYRQGSGQPHRAHAQRLLRHAGRQDRGEVMFRILWRLSRGYRLCPWRSPYLRWRIETYWGLHAEEITFAQFWSFAWRQRHELLRYLRWAERMS